MKILHVTSGVGRNGGGTSEVVPRLCEALFRRGHEVRLLAIASAEISHSAINAIGAGVDVRLRTKNQLFSHVSYGYSKELLKEINDGVKWGDIIHTHGLWQMPPIYAAFKAARAAKPYVMQPHGFLEPERLKKSRLRKTISSFFFERPALRKATAVIATAESEKAGLVQYGISNPIEIVPIGIDIDPIDKAQRNPAVARMLGWPEKKKIVLFFSRIEPIKGLNMLAEAWSSLSDFHDAWHLAIIGPDTRGYGPVAKGFFKDAISQGTCSFHGPVFGEEKFALLKTADVFVLPTRSENFGIVVPESLAAGLPVVCTKGAPWKIIEEGAGKWVDINSSAIADGLREIMSMTDEERRAMGQIGRSIVLREFSWPSIALKMEGIYGSILSGSYAKKVLS